MQSIRKDVLFTQATKQAVSELTSSSQIWCTGMQTTSVSCRAWGTDSRHCNALLRVRLVCCAKHYAALSACCIASGTAQLQHMQCVSVTAQHMKGCMFKHATKQGVRHCNALLRVQLVCCAKHCVASFACCMASGTAQLQHMQCVSITAQHAEHKKGCTLHTGHKAGCL